MKKIFLFVLFFLSLGGLVWADAPKFNDLKSNLESNNVVYSDINVDTNNSVETNIRNLFFPDTYNGGKIWEVLRIVMVGVLILYLVWAGYLFIVGAGNDGEIKKARMNLIYILYGAFLFFGVTWILGDALNVTQVSGTTGLIQNFQNNVMFQILAFLKAAAFFVAIIMLVYYGYKIMIAYEKEDKIKEGRSGVINVFIALAFIKIIDFIYYIAQQRDFKTQASSFIVSVSRVAGYVLGILLVLTIIYAGMNLITSAGNEDKWKKAKSAIKTVFLVTMMVFLFLLIINQILSEVTVG